MVMVVATRIGATFGIERRLDGVRVAAQPVHHVRDHVVGADADAVAEQLHRQMPVAEVPGDADQLRRAVGMDFEQRFGLGYYTDDTATFKRQAIAIAQPNGLWKVEQQFDAAFRGKHYAAAMAAVEIENHAIELGLRRPIA